MKRVKATELAIFARQLSTMISSGMSILRALYVLEEQTESKFLKETIIAVRKDVEAGLSLSDAMARHPKVFNPLFIAMTRQAGRRACARGRAGPGRRPAAEGRGPSPPDQIGDDLRRS
jgi:type II secretory pathway component PulF